ncbi:MAG: DUF6163 family protein [Croceibacterium sp.]
MSFGTAESAKPDRAGPWTLRLVLFLRIMAGLSMLKGLYHWSLVLGIGDGTGSTFESASMPWQAATIFFAVIDLVAAVGLWLAAAWGGVVWLTATISMAAIELGFPQVFGGRLWIAIPELATLVAYIGLALMAGRERPN